MSLNDVLTADFYRLVEFEAELREAWESEGHQLEDTALIVPLTQPEGQERMVNLALSQALGINVTSPDPGVIRISHPGCTGPEHVDCVILEGVPRDMDSADAVRVLIRLMTVTSVLQTAAKMAQELLDGKP